MTLKARIKDHILSNPGVRFTHDNLANVMNAPTPSVRRAALALLRENVINDAGPASYNVQVVTYVAPEAATV